MKQLEEIIRLLKPSNCADHVAHIRLRQKDHKILLSKLAELESEIEMLQAQVEKKSKIKYFHELSDFEYERLKDCGITWGQLSKLHPQPKWCKYPSAVNGPIGCCSLMGFLIKTIDNCSDCECIKILKEA